VGGKEQRPRSVVAFLFLSAGWWQAEGSGDQVICSSYVPVLEHMTGGSSVSVGRLFIIIILFYN